MKRIYHFYLTCMTLTLTMPMMIVSAFAVDDMWTVANNIIVDVYGKIVGVSTVLAGLMSAVAVIGAKLSNNQHKVDQAWTGSNASGSPGQSSTASAHSLHMLRRCSTALRH